MLSFKPWPQKERRILRANYIKTVSATAVIDRYPIPFLEYLSYDPLNLVQLYTSYQYTRVVMIHLKLKISNYGTAPLVLSTGVLPYNQFATVTPQALASSNGGKFIVVGSLVDSKQLEFRVPASKYVGVGSQLSQYWIDSAQSNSLVPVTVEEPILLFTIEPASGMMKSYVISWTVSFYVEAFEPLVNQL
jgi:hypothetical protein